MNHLFYAFAPQGVQTSFLAFCFGERKGLKCLPRSKSGFTPKKLKEGDNNGPGQREKA
jgi:hypothetical protein